MNPCGNTPPALRKACSGKCKSASCDTKTQVWVLATCEGMAALFQKQENGHLLPISHSTSFHETINTHLLPAITGTDAHHLVLVGSANDLSWTHMSMPEPLVKHVVAEINYPLIADWFTSSAEHNNRLAQALENIFLT